MEKDGALHLNKLESSSPKDALCQVWLKLAQRFWRRSVQILSMYFFYFVIIFPWEKDRALVFSLSLFHSLYYLPFKKRWGPSLEQTRVPITQGCIVPSLELTQWFRRRFFECRQCIFAISQLSPLGKGRGPSFEKKNWNPLHPKMHCAKFGWN